MNTKSLLFATLLIALSAPPALYAESPLPLPDDNAAAQVKEEALYSEGTRAINDAHWAQAESIFNNIASQHGGRAEAALYWEAYADNKQGNAAHALETCAELRHAYQPRKLGKRMQRAGNRDSWQERRSSAASGRTG